MSKGEPNNTSGLALGRDLFLYHGRTCVNARNPYRSLRAAVAAARQMQDQSVQNGQRPVTYRVVEGQRTVAEVEPS